MNSKRVLIITYYWPPSGASGVQRWLKFAKYLPENGWTPVIYTPENPERPAVDHSLVSDIPKEAEVLTHPIFEPYGFYKKLTGRKADEVIHVGFVNESDKPGWLETASRWLRGNFLIPDARRFWIRPSVRRLSNYLNEHPVDAIVSTGPPHSMHLIALRLTNRFNIPWLADFRDPWSRFYYNDDLMFNSRTRNKQHRLERSVLKKADTVITVSDVIRKELQEIGGRAVDLIHNGYDPAEYTDLTFEPSSSFIIAHTGAFQSAANPETVWKVLGQLVRSHSDLAADLKILLVGKVDTAIKESINRYGLDPFVHYTGYLPHSKVMCYQVTSALLLLCILRTKGAEGIITGKFFEYLASETPVMCIGPVNGDTAAIIRQCRAGETVGPDDSATIERIVLRYYDQWKKGEPNAPHRDAISTYSRREQTRELAGMLNDLIRNDPDV